MSQAVMSFESLDPLAAELRQKLKDKKYILLYAYNGTGKTRLSMAFKNLGKQDDARDTLYFNAFTQDLFTWDNDLEDDTTRVLKLNSNSRFFDGLKELEMETRIRSLLHRHVDFDFTIDTEKWEIVFSRDEQGETLDNIKVSRGEENLFIWCFFLAIVQLVLDNAEAYSWVKHIYIDDPVSSLDDNNIIGVAHQLAQMLKLSNSNNHFVISSHHALFFNVVHNELKRALSFFLAFNKKSGEFTLRETGETPFFHHVAMLAELYQAEKSGRLYTYHFSMLRTLLEKSASFHGFSKFSDCISPRNDDPDGILHARLINVLNHGGYSLFEPKEMLEENKAHFKRILDDFLSNYSFNPNLFVETSEEEGAS